ncbi:ATP-dependent RNA helicase DbpA [Salinisphaera aquimarina]|uniref:ATP-dependent RNA helicase DbpA n=1 Tax=Salinisphaera aquimarina TaxID=2094031 RepID=A0ABV7EU88_9GAMM
MTAFNTLDLRPELLASVDSLGYPSMTPIQAQSLPPILLGRDVIAQAITGSGKTAAFGLGLLQTLTVEEARLQALVLCPTRELADQVSRAIRALATALPNVKLLTLCGGVPMRPQLASLAHEPHVVVGTPGRVLAHLRRESLDCSSVRTLVLDEADRMLDMGFGEDLTTIVGYLDKRRQTLLFSATWPPALRVASEGLQHDAVEVTVDESDRDDAAIEQRFHEIAAVRKPDALAQILDQEAAGDAGSAQALVFCNMRRDVDAVQKDLDGRGLSALALHGDMEQRDRDEVLIQFVNRSCAVLVATDVAARGLDIVALPLVVSYDMANDPDTHTHRIGRTGRAGESGLAITLCTAQERSRADHLKRHLGAPLSWHPLVLEKPRAKTLKLAPMKTLVIDGGRRDKLRPGDILGALTGDAGLSSDAIGKIDIAATRAYVAIRRDVARAGQDRLSAGRIKGRKFRVRALS